MQQIIDSDDGLLHMPRVAKWQRTLRELDMNWRLIESTARMVCPAEAKSILPTVRATREGFSALETQLLTSLVHECTMKCAQEIHFKARVIIDIVVRNLFERTADVGFLATDQAIRAFILDPERDPRQLQPRLREYRNKYTVYDEILILDTAGKVLAHLDDKVELDRSHDPLIAQTLTSDSYVETFRASDLRPGHDDCLIYSRTISDPRSGKAIGVLCLCFPLGVEMQRVFDGLGKKANHEVMLMLDRSGRVIASSDTDHVPKGALLAVTPDSECALISYAGRDYLAKTCAARDYQGYRGPGWCGHVMVPLDAAFRRQQNALPAADGDLLAGVMAHAESFCPPLHDVVRNAERINIALRRVVWNGQVMCAGEGTDMLRLKSFLAEISQASGETGSVFRESIGDLYATVLSSSLQDIQAISRLMIDIADRNLYERANDCRWWALTPLLRQRMARAEQDDDDRERIKQVLDSINALYTAYTRLLVFNPQGVVIASSDLHGDGIDAAELVIDQTLVRKTLALRDSQAYCVSPFEASALYGGRPTYIYCAAIRHPTEAGRVVGGIGIVFDAEPEFRNILLSGLPQRPGAFAAFVERSGKVISCTDAGYPPGSQLSIDKAAGSLKHGMTEGGITVHEDRYLAVAHTMSSGYREYKNGDNYQNDVLAIVAIPIGAVIPHAPVSVGAGSDADAHRRRERGREFVSFTVEQGLFALAASDVVEAVDAAQVCHSATLKLPLAGMLNHLGDDRRESALIPVIDMHALVGSGPCAAFDNCEVIVVRHGSRTFGMLVGALGGMLEVARDEIEPSLELPRQNAYVRDLIKTGEQGAMVQVFDLGRLAGLVFGA
jgi:chemotaxis signal transduction protein